MSNHEKEITEIEGVISAVRQRPEGYHIHVGDDWFGGWGKCRATEGSRVALKFYEKDGYKNIVSIRLLEMEEPELDDAELLEVLEKARQQNRRIAAESIEDAKRLLSESGLRNALTPQNVVRFAERLTERRILHVSRVIEDYKQKKRFLRRMALQAPAQKPHDLPKDGED